LVGWAGCITAIVLVLSGTASAARTWTVCASGCNFTTIASAVAAASNGDTILVHSGTYAGGFLIDKDLRLIGAGFTNTRIVGGAPVLTVGSDAEVNLEPLTDVLIDGFSISGGTPGPWTAGIQINGRLTLRRSLVTKNTGDGDFFGAGITNFGVLEMTDSTVSQNLAQLGGGCAIASEGFFNFDRTTFSMKNSRVASNEGTRGGVCLGDGTYRLQDSSVTENSGVGVMSFISFTNLSNMTISRNHNGGVFHCLCDVPSDVLTIENSRIVDNSTQGSGGGVTNDRLATTTITNSTISRNHAGQNGGGLCGDFNVTRSTISANTAAHDGGGFAGTGTISHSLIERNSAGVDGGGIWNLGVTLTDTTVGNNTPNNTAAGPPLLPGPLTPAC
jgi:hypothetical protein